MKKIALTIGIAAASIAASLAFAGPGYGPGAGCAAGTTATACPGGGMGPGMGMGGGHGLGLNLMTPAERDAHRAKMRSLTSLKDCNDYLSDHRAAIAARAAEKGITLPEPRGNACERMQARGRFG